MARRRMKTRKDHSVYTNTAAKIKKINVNPCVNRGGIRL